MLLLCLTIRYGIIFLFQFFYFYEILQNICECTSSKFMQIFYEILFYLFYHNHSKYFLRVEIVDIVNDLETIVLYTGSESKNKLLPFSKTYNIDVYLFYLIILPHIKYIMQIRKEKNKL